MDAVKFIKEAKRMCQRYEKCEACPVYGDGYDDCRIDAMHDIDEEIAVDIVEKWANEHPRETRNSEFLKHYPNARIQKNGTVELCPKWIDQSFDEGSIICHRTRCDRCKEEYWLREVE